MKQNDIAILILTCDKFKITWKPCIDHFFNVWPECPHPVYLLNNHIPSKDKRIKDLLVGEDNNWSDTLRKGLIKLNHKRVFFIFDDSFITSINVKEVKLIFDIAVYYDLESVSLRKRSYDDGKPFNGKLYKLKSTTKYRNSLFLNLCKIDLILDLLKSGENAWQFEKEGNDRSKKYEFYSIYYNIVTYYHGIVKGKWLPETYIYLKNKGYNINENPFSILNKFQVIKLQIYTYIFDIVQKVLHLIK